MNRAAWMGFVLLGLAAMFLVLSTPGSAEVSGPCTGTVNGQAITDERIVVPDDGTVAYAFQAQSPPRSWSMDLRYAGAAIDLDDGSSDTNATSISGVADVGDYAWMGVGLYELEGTIRLADGSTCSSSILIEVQGNPLATLVGATAAGASVVGVGGGGFASFLSIKAALP